MPIGELCKREVIFATRDNTITEATNRTGCTKPSS
jgi:hypothetical protein